MAADAKEGSNLSLQKILSTKEKNQANLIPILQEVQKEYGYLSKETLICISEYLEMSANEVYGVASFYQQFRFAKPGKHIITVCLGTACFVKGGNVLSEAIKTKLCIDPGETTDDGLISFETVACLECCANAPIVKVDGEVHGEMKPAKLLRIIDKIMKGKNGK